MILDPSTPSGNTFEHTRLAWAARADELATWAWLQVNRTDVWGGYHSFADRGKPYTKADGKSAVLGHVTTRPLPSARGRIYLTPEILAQHFRATAPEHVVGLHTTSPDNLSRWGAVEVDQHGDGGNTAKANLVAVLAWYDKLKGLGFRPLLTDSNGGGGHHLRILLALPVATPRIFGYLKSLISDYADHGLIAQPELFPKQPRIEVGKFGNWLRLPGRHHTREHWAQVWNGSRWLVSGDAVDFLLALSGDSPYLVPPEPFRRPDPPRPPRPGLIFCMRAGGAGLQQRIMAYMSRLPNLGQGQGRDDVAYSFGAFLTHDLALDKAVALEWLVRWDMGNSPPKGRDCLAEILENAVAYGQRQLGCGLHRDSPRRLMNHSIQHLDFTVFVEA